MRALYLECGAGVSGDMLVAALLDLGASQEALEKALDSVKAEGFSYEIARVKKVGIDCCDFAVLLDPEHENHDHDMAYLHGLPPHEDVGNETFGQGRCCGRHRHDHEETAYVKGVESEPGIAACHVHSHDHVGHNHAHGAGLGHCVQHRHEHRHRGLKEIAAILNEVQMSEKSKALAFKIFDILAEAEAEAHAAAKEEVHFHEVGAIDSIADIVAIAVCLDSLSFDEVVVTGLSEGSGTVRCQHGVLPVPVPATLNIVRKYGIRLRPLGVEGEFVTPTGAAAVAAIRTRDTLPKEFKVSAVGLGAGKRRYAVESILRAMLIEA